jgi:uncharacterized protein (DUF1800 family)
MTATSVSVQNGPREAVHFLNRAGFGPRPGQVREVLARGLPNYVQDQLDAGPDPRVEKRIANQLGDQHYSVTEMISIYRGQSPFSRKDLPLNGVMRMLDNFYTAKLFRTVGSRSQLYEAAADFWFNHFNVSRISAREAAIAYERDAIRPHVWGRFRDLLGATASHPAMLFYLDNYLNRRDELVGGKLVRGINENYGRELLELHTVGVTAGYTQQDVVDAARAFTGWTLDNPRGDLSSGSGGFLFRPEEHDTSAKRIFGLELPAGGGREDGEKLLDHLADHPATARFISRKLVRRFVADDPPQSLVDRCAQTFTATRGDLRKVVAALIDSPEFWRKPEQPKYRTPFEFVVSALRAVDARVESAVPGLVNYLDVLGMRPFHCTPPTGYADGGGDWLSPTYLHRLNFALSLAAGKIVGVQVNLPELIASRGGKPEDARSVVSVMNREIFGDGLSDATVEAASAPALGLGVMDRLHDLFSTRTHGLQTDAGRTLVSKVVGLVLASPEMQMRLSP